MKNILKKSKKGMTPGIMVLMILVIAIVVGGVVWFATSDGIGQQVVTPEAKAEACGIDSPLTVNAFSELNPGTAITTPTITCGANGGKISTSVTSGTTKFTSGSQLVCLISKDDYIDKSFSFEMTCGGYTLDAGLYYATSDNPSIKIINDEGDYMADSSNDIIHSGTNQTNVAVGEAIKWDLEIGGTSLESSGEGVLVIEYYASTSANVTKVELSGATPTNVPSVHTSVNAGSKIVAFSVPATIGSAKNVYTLTTTLGATKDLQNSTLFDWYTVQEFIDDDATISSGVEDSDGTAKSENSLDFDVHIEASDE